MKKLCFMFLFILSGSILLAQGDAAVPFLYLNPSPQLNGLGMAGTSLPNNDAFGFYYNPAQLGYESQTDNISFQVYPSKTNWLGANSSEYGNVSVNLGYNFEKILNGLKLSVGIGYIHSRIDYGIFSSISSTYDSYDQFNTYGIGIGLDYYIQLNFGISYKRINSKLSDYVSSSNHVNNMASISAVDFGFLATIPFVKLIDPGFQFNFLEGMPVAPYANFSIGYAKLNIGDKIWYVDPAQSDPLPRTARLGYTVSLGANLRIKNSSIKAVGYDFTVDADDDLIKTGNPNPVTYQSFLGDINVGKNLIELKSDDKVVVHKGHKITLFETVSFLTGRFSGRGYYNDKSTGIGIQAKGILTMLKGFTDNYIFDFIADHVDIQYYSTSLFYESPIETKFEGLNLVFYGYSL